MGIGIEIFAEGFRDKILDTKIVATLIRALGEPNSYIADDVIKFFIGAIAQGVPGCFDGY